MATALYSVLHFLVDFACAHAMFLRFIDGPVGYAGILVYNFCAFAMQMPMGALLDCFAHRTKQLPQFFVLTGVLLTIVGSLTHPLILGLGNAAFHVGGGVGTIREDNARNWKGRALGVFVAPGALGLFIGTQLASFVDITFFLSTVMALLSIPLFVIKAPESSRTAAPGPAISAVPLLCCFLVVILRSYVGMAVAFPWKQGLFFGLAAVLAVVLGKVAGGFASARFGTRNTIVTSLLLAAACFFLGDKPVFGILALFLFNMTMPITLYQLALRFPSLPGFSFGLLTFALFLGFLPVYAGLELSISGTIIGSAGSLISLTLLLPVSRRNRI